MKQKKVLKIQMKIIIKNYRTHLKVSINDKKSKHEGAASVEAVLLSNGLEFSVHLAQGTGAAEREDNGIVAK